MIKKKRKFLKGFGREIGDVEDTDIVKLQMSRLVGKPTMWFPNRSDTNQPVQAQERARSLKFRI